jgi:hypothetical protein
MWWLPPPGGGGLPESLDVATVDGHAVLAFAARRVDGSTSQPYGAPNTDVFVRTRSGEGHWEPGERVDRDIALLKRPGEPRVWTSDRETFVGFDDDPLGGGTPVVARRLGHGWSGAQRLIVDGEPGEMVLVSPDGGRVIRVGATFVFQDMSGRTVAKVDDVGRENDVVSTGAGTFAAASIVGDPGRGEDQRFEIHELGGPRDRVTRLTVGPATNLDLYPDGRGGAELVTTTFHRGRETQRIVARHLRDGRLSRPRTIAAAVSPEHSVIADGQGRLVVAWRDHDGITIERSDGARRTISAARPAYQFLIAAAGEHLAVVYSSGGRLVVARSDGERFAQLPLLPGRFAQIDGLGFGYRTVDYGAPRFACFAFARPARDGSGMTGWQTTFRVMERGRVVIAVRHRADVLVATIDPDSDEWSYGEGGTRAKTASGDVVIDADGDPVVAWVDVTDGTHRVFASSVATSSRGGDTIAFGAVAGALALLGLALRLRRRAD